MRPLQLGAAAATADNILSSRSLFAVSLVTWTALVLIDSAVAVLFYALLRPTGHTLSLLAAALRLVYAAMLGAFLLNLYDAFRLLTDPDRAGGLDPGQVPVMALSALNTFDGGFDLALVIFGVHLAVLGLLLYRSRYVPRALGVFVMASGGWYLADNFGKLLGVDYGAAVNAVLFAIAAPGELGLIGWLLVKGVRTSHVPHTSLG